ncbi:MAG: MerR family transcriptional regulator [Phycisphaerae bacterium]|nr:MerR family transcriptional regulator [Phycisphaerae bacterium]
MDEKKSNKEELLSISRAAKQAGISKQTLQYYLMVGLLEASGRTKSGAQLFDHKAIERIQLIKKLNDSGYPLREIREIFLHK